jgi:hypothetical protein
MYFQISVQLVTEGDILNWLATEGDFLGVETEVKKG